MFTIGDHHVERQRGSYKYVMPQPSEPRSHVTLYPMRSPKSGLYPKFHCWVLLIDFNIKVAIFIPKYNEDMWREGFESLISVLTQQILLLANRSLK